ncbi:hypothetical protein J2S73_003468 [Amorphus orientalis]|uniref:Uncharacterized protein n=1 Tax=Amorphus orientalis TaxID=649198 RepID=A0AAE4AT73_9HYPH|nr:hypothetical protein [Amorphus orientalis]
MEKSKSQEKWAPVFCPVPQIPLTPAKAGVQGGGQVWPADSRRLLGAVRTGGACDFASSTPRTPLTPAKVEVQGDTTGLSPCFLCAHASSLRSPLRGGGLTAGARSRAGWSDAERAVEGVLAPAPISAHSRESGSPGRHDGPEPLFSFAHAECAPRGRPTLRLRTTLSSDRQDKFSLPRPSRYATHWPTIPALGTPRPALGVSPCFGHLRQCK